jgi:single-stranded DNA-binding protein
MHSQLYVAGTLVADPELAQKKKQRLWVKLMLETRLVRETRPGEFQSELVILPVALFSHEAEKVKELRKGDSITLGAHLYGTEFQTSSGAIKRGIQLIADQVFLQNGKNTV